MAKPKIEDVTKTGPQSYRDLQKTNQEALQQASQVSPMTNLKPVRGYRSSLDFVYEGAEQSPIQRQGKGDYWGNSMFDETSANEEDYMNLSDTRARNQPWYAQVAAGFAKGALLAGTTFLDGTLGLLFGAGTAASEKRFSGLWDNDFSKAMQAVNEFSEELMPNYYTEEEQNSPWYENIFTANFLGDKFIKNLGFTIGAFYSGNLYSSGIGAAMKLMKASTNAATMVTSGVGATLSAINEGRIEALNNSKDWYDTQKLQLDDTYQQRLSDIQQEYESTKGYLSGSLETGFIDPAYERYQDALAKEQANYEDALGRLNEDRLKMGNVDLLMNIPILTASNIIQFGKLYARGFRTGRRNNNIIGGITEGFRRGTTKGDGIRKAILDPLSEGTEEITQGMASRISGDYYSDDADVTNYYKAKTDPEAQQKTLSWWKSFAQGINETINDGSAWEEFFIGTLTGALGMPQFRSMKNAQGKFQSPITIEGGILGELKENREQIEREDRIVDYLNKRIQSPEFKNYYQGLTRHIKLQDTMNQAIQDGDKFSFKNAEFAQFISDISMFDAAGKIGDLTTLINSAYDISDENLQSIVNNTTSIVTAGEQALQINQTIQYLTQVKQDAEQRGDTHISDQIDNQIQLLNDQLLSLKDTYVGPFVNSNGNPLYATEDGKQEMIDELTDIKNSMMKWIDYYVKIKTDLQSRLPQNIGEDQLEELIFLQAQVDDFEERIEFTIPIIKDILTEASTSLRTLASAQDIIGNPKDSEKYKSDAEYIESLIQDNTNEQLMQMLSNPKNNQFILWISSIINTYGNDIIRHLDKQYILEIIDDIAKMGQYKDLYQKRLQEYITNPSAQIQAHEQARQQQETERKASQDISKVDKINNSSVSELVQASENGEIDFDSIDKLFEEEEATDAKDKVEQAKDIVDTDRRAREGLEQLNSDGVISDQELADATALLNQSKSVSESSDELLDLDTEAFNDPSILDDGDTRESIQKQAEEEGWSLEQIKSEFEDAMGQRLDKAKNALSTVKSFGLERDAKLSDIPSGTPQQTTPTETIQTGHDSVDKNEPINTPKQQQPDSNSTIANKIMSDAGLSDEQAAKSIKEVLDYADSLIKKDVKGSNLRDFLQATISYQKVTEYGPKVLDALHKAINGKISQTQQSAPQQKQQAQPKQEDTTPIIMPSSIDEQINDENKRDINNQGTEAFQEEVQKEGTSASTQKANGTYNYWRPSTTELPIHRERGNDTPYWQTVKSDIRERLQAVYEYLKSHGAFSRVNNNQVKQGDEIHFGISKELSDKLGKPIILILNSNDEVIGDLPMPEDASFNSYVGLSQLYEEASNWYKENHESLHTNGNDIAVIPGYKSRVARNMVGKPQYTSQNERNTLNQINTVTTSDGSQKQIPFRLGIAIANADSGRVRIMSDAGRSKSQGASPLERTIIAPLRAMKGQPFLLMPTSSNTRAFMPVPIMMPTFDMSNPSVANSALGQEVSKKVQELTTIPNDTDQIIKWINSMQELLAIPEIHVNFSTPRFSAEGRMPQELIVTIRRPGETTQATIFKGPQEQAVDAVLSGLNGSMFQVSRKYINDTYNGRSYNEMIGELAETNLPIGATHTINDWFTIDPIVDKKQQKAHSPKSTRVNPTQTQGTVIRFQDASGNTYYLTSSNRLYKENPNGNDIELTDSKYNYLKAHAYGARIGETYTRPYDTPWGYYNPQTNKFEVKPAENIQRKVVATYTHTTSNGRIRVIEVSEKSRTIDREGTTVVELEAVIVSDSKNPNHVGKVVTGAGLEIDLDSDIVDWKMRIAGGSTWREDGTKVTPDMVTKEEEDEAKEEVKRLSESVIDGKQLPFKAIKIFYAEDGRILAKDRNGEVIYLKSDPLTQQVTKVTTPSTQTTTQESSQKPSRQEVSLGDLKVGDVYELSYAEYPNAKPEAYTVEEVKPDGKLIVHKNSDFSRRMVTPKNINDYGTPRIVRIGQSTQQTKPQSTRQDSLDALKKMGLLNKKERNAALDKLSDDRLAQVASMPKLKARQTLERFDTRIKANMDSDAINDAFDSVIGSKPLNREVTKQIDKAKSWNIEDEVQRVIKILPQLGRDGAVRFVDTLIEIARSSRPAYAWGQFQNGIITLSKLAARGTMYHEAFHFVTQSLLSKEELAELYKDARGKKKLTNLEVEEKLAEDFRRYMQSYEDNGFFINIFNKLKRFIKALVGKETITNKLFQDIRNGALASRTVISNRVSFNRQETYTQEQQNILKNAPRDNQGRLLAPNGKPTNLNERQWLQVRTTAFKNWFGDWENVEKFNINNVDTTKVDIEKVDKPWKNDNTKVNKTLRIYLKNQHEKGYFELVKDQEFGIYSVHFKTGNANTGETFGSTKEERNILYEQILNVLPNGAQLSTWGELSQGGIKALNKLGQNLKKIGERQVKDRQGNNLTIPIYQKGNGVSKVVDENGEPLVVYHGTNVDFNTFKLDKAGINTGLSKYKDLNTGEEFEEDSASTFFFSDRKGVAKSYGFIGAQKSLLNTAKRINNLITLILEKPLTRSSLGKDYDKLLQRMTEYSEFNPRFTKVKEYLVKVGERGLNQKETEALRKLLIETRRQLENQFTVISLSDWSDQLYEVKLFLKQYNTKEGVDRLLQGEIPEILLKEHKYSEDKEGYLALSDGSFNTSYNSIRYDEEQGLTINGKKVVEMSSDELKTTLDHLENVANNLEVSQSQDNGRQIFERRSFTRGFFLNIRDPFSHNYEGTKQGHGYKGSKRYSFGYIAARQVKKAHNNGNDGVIYENIYDPYLANNYGVFHPNQIKSAEFNIGEFSTTNDNVYYREIEQYYREKLDYGRLNQEQKDYITERGLTIEEYNSMTPQEREVLFRCMY